MREIGEPIKIYDLMANFIKSPGYTPNEDIQFEENSATYQYEQVD